MSFEEDGFKDCRLPLLLFLSLPSFCAEKKIVGEWMALVVKTGGIILDKKETRTVDFPSQNKK